MTDIEIDEKRGELYQEALDLYLEVVGTANSYDHDDKLEKFVDYHTRGKILTRVRAVEAILRMYDSFVHYLGRLKEELQDWLTHEKKGGTQPFSATFSSSDEVQKEIDRVSERVAVYLDELSKIVDKEDNEKVMNGVGIFFGSRYGSHQYILGRDFQLLTDLYQQVKNHPQNDVI